MIGKTNSVRCQLILVLILIGGLSASLYGQDYTSWGKLKPGEFKVGFRTIPTYDSSRSYNQDNGKKFRPLLIHLWYPSNTSEENGLLAYKSYIVLESQRENFEKNSFDILDHYCRQTMSGYIDYGKKLMGDLNVTVDDVLSSKTAALWNAEQAKEIFPLIIYAPSLGKSSIQNNVACEYFASHGYIVASVASTGESSVTMTKDEKGIMAQVHDIEYVVDYLRTSNAINFSNIGSFGFSWGGLANIIHQMRNEYVRAVASWDGSIEYDGYDIAKSMNDFNPKKMNTPFIFFSNKNQDWTEFSFYKSISSNEKYLYRLNQLEHSEFTSYWTVFTNSKISGSTYSLKGYKSVCESTLIFFDIYLKRKKSMTEKLENPDTEIMTKLKVK